MVSFLAAASFVLAYPSAASEPSRPELSGRWVLDQRASTDLEDLIVHAKASRGAGRNGGGGGRGGGRGGGSGTGRGAGRSGGGGHGSNDGDRQEAQQKHLRELEQRLAELEIFHAGHELNVTDGMKISRLLYTDGRETTIWTERGPTTAAAVWQGATLVVRWQGEDGGDDRLRKYILDEGGTRLTVREERHLPGQEQAVTLELVYNRVRTDPESE